MLKRKNGRYCLIQCLFWLNISFEIYGQSPIGISFVFNWEKKRLQNDKLTESKMSATHIEKPIMVNKCLCHCHWVAVLSADSNCWKSIPKTFTYISLECLFSFHLRTFQVDGCYKREFNSIREKSTTKSHFSCPHSFRIPLVCRWATYINQIYTLFLSWLFLVYSHLKYWTMHTFNESVTLNWKVSERESRERTKIQQQKL